MSFRNFITTSLLVFTILLVGCDGDASQQWKNRINKKIDLIRKKATTLTFDSNIYGKNAKLMVNQTRMSFPMGTAVKAKFISTCLENGANDRYCEFVRDNYNYIVVENAMKWPQWEPERGTYKTKFPDNTITWAHNNGMGVRGHNLFWAVGKDYQIPDWVKNLKGDEMREAIDHRITTAVTHYKGLVDHWDVNNEMLHGQFYVDATGDPDIRVDMFKKVQKASPTTLRFVNDYSILLWQVDDYIHQIRELLENGAPINGIGIQAHLGPSSIDLQKVEHSLDKLWNAFGIPIWITEFDWANPDSGSDNHEQHAIELENFYRLMFSHPGVQGVLMWGFWDQAHWKPEAALVNGDNFVLNRAGETYISLFHEKFRTNEIIEPKMWEWKWNGNGNVKNGNLLKYKFRGFRGTYTLTLILEDGTNVPIMDDYIL